MKTSAGRRKLLHEEENVKLLGDENRLIFVFKNGPMKTVGSFQSYGNGLSNYHASLGRLISAETPEIENSLLKIKAIAVIKNKGMFFLKEKSENSLSLRANSRYEMMETPIENGYIGSEIIVGRAERWFRVIPSLFPERPIKKKLGAIRVTEFERCLNKWAEMYWTGKDFSVENVLEGLSEKLCFDFKKSNPNIKVLPRSRIFFNLKRPSLRRMINNGGMKDVFSTLAGTKSNKIISLLSGHLFRLRSTAASLGEPSYEEVIFDYELIHEVGEIIKTIGVDNTIKFLGVLLKITPEPGYRLPVYLAKTLAGVGTVEKIVRKIEEELASSKAHGEIVTILNEITHILISQPLLENFSYKQKKFFPKGIQVKGWKTFKELHDILSKQDLKLRTLGNSNHVGWFEDMKNLHGTTIGDLKLKLPRSTVALVAWGASQGHCISSYSGDAVKGKSVIIGAYKLGKIEYCIRVSVKNDQETNFKPTFRLVEFRGRKNEWPSPEDAADVINVLKSFGIDCEAWENTGNGFGSKRDDDWFDRFVEAGKIDKPVVLGPGILNFTGKIKNK